MTKVFVALGLDCDRPRGDFIHSSAGKVIAQEKYQALEYIASKLDGLHMPRTYFICGQFLESMSVKFGVRAMSTLFESRYDIAEVADHTYSHNIFKPISARPDKSPISFRQIIEEYRYNTDLFSRTFQKDLKKRGLRTPLGHFGGLKGEDELILLLVGEGVRYLSSDLRDENNSICPALVSTDGSLRQPYFYPAGILEIPSHGWHDTAFGNLSKTPLDRMPPCEYEEICDSYYVLFQQAVQLASSKRTDMYIGLVLHPYNIWQYDKPRRLFDDLNKFATELGIEFVSYDKIYYNLKPNH